MRYELIWDDTAGQLSETVTKGLRDGWELHGDPILAVTCTGAAAVCAQATTREHEPLTEAMGYGRQCPRTT